MRGLSAAYAQQLGHGRDARIEVRASVRDVGDVVVQLFVGAPIHGEQRTRWTIF